jgi:hypothetical protein
MLTHPQESVPARRGDPGVRRLVRWVAALIGLDLVGGALAIAAGVNTPTQAWSAEATLAAPVPMMVAQVVLAGCAARYGDRRGAVAAGLLAVACLVSAASGFFDGQLGRADLPVELRAAQLCLVAATVAVGALATARLVRLLRRPMRRGA